MQPGVRRENLKQLKEAGGVGRNLYLTAQMGTTAMKHREKAALSSEHANTHKKSLKVKVMMGKSTRADT